MLGLEDSATASIFRARNEVLDRSAAAIDVIGADGEATGASRVRSTVMKMSHPLR
jgi:hypothetical protein